MDEPLPSQTGQPGALNSPLPAETIPDQPAAPQPAATPPTPPASEAGFNPRRYWPLLILLVLALFLMGYFFFNRQSSIPNTPAETPAAATADQSAELIPAAVSPTGIETLQYQLPTGWIENPAEGEITPQISFLKRLRSPDGCHTLVVGRFLTEGMSLNNFVISQYPGRSLLELQHYVQFEVAGAKSFTVKPQAAGESFTFFVQGKDAVFYGIFASYNLSPDDAGNTCAPESPELTALMQSVALP